MCRTFFTIIHHDCHPHHLTRQTAIEQCYAARLVDAHTCAPRSPRHHFYERHLPGAACRSCARAQNEDEHVHFSRRAYEAPMPPFSASCRSAHERVPHAGPAISTDVRNVHIHHPPIEDLVQLDRKQQLPPGGISPSDDDDDHHHHHPDSTDAEMSRTTSSSQLTVSSFSSTSSPSSTSTSGRLSEVEHLRSNVPKSWRSSSRACGPARTRAGSVRQRQDRQKRQKPFRVCHTEPEIDCEQQDYLRGDANAMRDPKLRAAERCRRSEALRRTVMAWLDDVVRYMGAWESADVGRRKWSGTVVRDEAGYGWRR